MGCERQFVPSIHRVSLTARCWFRFLALGVTLAFTSCGSPVRQAAGPAGPPIPTGLPVIELPPIDFARGGPRVSGQGLDTMALPHPIPFGQFGVRVEALVPGDMKAAPTRGVLFYVYQRGTGGRLVAAANAALTAKATGREGVVLYEGACLGPPMHRGDAIVEVSYRDKSYLIRSASIR